MIQKKHKACVSPFGNSGMVFVRWCFSSCRRNEEYFQVVTENKKGILGWGSNMCRRVETFKEQRQAEGPMDHEAFLT